jgi:hypothetical protein
MAYTFEELKHKTVADLRKIASDTEHEALKGYSQLNKEHLLAALCKAFNLDMHVHHHVEGVNKADIKKHIKEMKKKRDAALEAHDHAQIKFLRRQIHHLKRKLHKATV